MPSTNNTLPLDDFQIAANDNTFANAAEFGFIDSSLTVADNVQRRDRNDFIHFAVRRDASIDIALSGLSGDVDLDLYDGRRRRIGRAFTRGVVSESITDSLAAGDYYVRVRSKPAVDSNYLLSIDVELAPPPAQFDLVPDYGSFDDWNLNAINAPEVWNAGYTGAGVTVAIVDSGVKWSHSDLVGSIWQNPGEISGDGIDNDNNGFIDDVRGWDFVQDDADPDDGGTHGTHVAGTVVAARDGNGSTGVAYGADIMPIRVLDSDSGFYSDVAKGIRYAVDNGADVINLSLGGGFNGLVYSALQHAAANDVLVVAASGNSNFARPGFPARHSMQLTNVLSVGSHTINGEMSEFSNGASGARDLQVDAPGSSILSTLPTDDYGFKSGTSMATPHVAGIAALIMSANGDLNATQVRDLIVAGASEYIIGRRASGGVNASISVYEATQTAGLATVEQVLGNATTATVADDGLLIASSEFMSEGANNDGRTTRRMSLVRSTSVQKSTELVASEYESRQAPTLRPSRTLSVSDRSRSINSTELSDNGVLSIDEAFAEWSLS